MNDAVWYYVDHAQQRHGPVPAADVADAVRVGRAGDTSLVWREGMAEWAPLGGFRAELGLPDAPAVAAPQPNPPPGPLPPPGAPAGTPPVKSGKGCLIAALVVGGLGVLAFLGIIAAIALPAYQDYLHRSQVAAAYQEARSHQEAVDAFVANTDRCPREPSEIALPAPTSPSVASLSVGEAETGMCTIEVVFGGGENRRLDGQSLTLSRDAEGAWWCTGDFETPLLLPADCR